MSKPRIAAAPRAPPMMALVGMLGVDEGAFEVLGFDEGAGELDESPDAEGDGPAEPVVLAAVAEEQEGPGPTATSFCSVVGLACQRVNSFRS